MKKEFLIYSLTLAVMTGSSLAMAQESEDGGKRGHGSPEMRAQRQERMREHLGLSDEQVEQMDAIRESDASREEKREQIRGILNDEQRAKMEQMGEKRRSAREAGGKDYRSSHQDPSAYEEEEE